MLEGVSQEFSWSVLIEILRESGNALCMQSEKIKD